MFEIRPFSEDHIDRAYEFLLDTFRISFGPDKACWPNNLKDYHGERYRSDVQKLLADKTFSYFSVYNDNHLIGQIELKNLKDGCGYVSFYYLIPEFRNKGFGRKLDEFAVNEFKRRGLSRMRLAVGELNRSGIRFYEKNGWKSVGTDPKFPMGIIMEKIIE